jgi:hypothetical protein
MLLSELDYASYMDYTPRPDSDIKKQSKNLMLCLKNEGTIGNPPTFMSKFIASEIKKQMQKLPFKHFFNPHVHLVPVPKSSLMKRDSLWVPYKITNALSEMDLGKCFNLLERIEKVPKAAFSKPEDRPKTIDHYRSIKVKTSINQPKQILLVDDVVTSGSTLLGCASRLQQTFPESHIRGFAVVRTISKASDFQSITNPLIGKITRFGQRTHREP